MGIFKGNQFSTPANKYPKHLMQIFYGMRQRHKRHPLYKNIPICKEWSGEEEAPEPLEPTFIDLDERIREKEEESRPVIANGVEYGSYTDYLKSREEEEYAWHSYTR